MEVLLIGPPNVGKSVLFNRLTGIDVFMANYPGTTVDYKRGHASVGDRRYTLVDVPGTYDLEASNEAERVAIRMLEGKPSGIVFVLDAKNLEASMHLLLQVLEKGLPTVAVVNRSDLVRGKVDTAFISQELGIPVVTSIATQSQGLDEIKSLVGDLLEGKVSPSVPRSSDWREAERISSQAKVPLGEMDRIERWGELMVRPIPGIPIAILVMVATFGFVVGLGMGLRQMVILPLFRGHLFPFIEGAVTGVVSDGVLLNILIGDYGVLIKTIEWPLGLVLPYIISFYLALSILEDSGYLPRLAVLIDGLFRRIGLSGSHIIPFLLGYGCAVPAIMSTRNINDRRKRIMVSAMVCMSVPCVAQSGAFISLLAEASIWLVPAIFLFSLLAAFTFGMVLKRVMGINREVMIQEVPDLLLPDLNILGKKLWIRVRHFLSDGVLPMAVIIAVAAVLYETGVLIVIGEMMEPLVVGWLGLPAEAATPLLLGVFRRELTVLPLLDMDLSMLQLFTASVVALLYIPCIAVIGVLAKEFDLRTAAYMLIVTMVVSFAVGGLIYQIASIIL